MTSDSIFIDLRIGDSVQETKRFAIKRTDNDQTKLDVFGFDIKLDHNETMHVEQLNVSLQITTNAYDGIAFQMFIDSYALDAAMGAICGGIIYC